MKARLAAVATFCLLATFVLAQEGATDDNQNAIIRHVVLFKFKEEAPESKIREIEAAFAALSDKIDEVADLEWGTDNSPEELAKGFTHCFFVTFNSAEDRDAYLLHPAHTEFVKLLRPHLEEALVLDYTPQKK